MKKKTEKEPPRPVQKMRTAGSEVSEGFRSARSAIDQITADLERLRHHAASLVKGAARTAK
jgi:hypothetical protein